MENIKLVCSQDSEGLGSDKIVIGFCIGATIVTIIMGIKAWRIDKAFKTETEKNLQYQEIIRKHQAEIDAVKNDMEREVYKKRLWNAIMAETER